MTLTLWRGDQLLGTIHLRASSTEKQIEGVVVPAPGASLSGIWQSHLFIPGHIDAVTQHPMEPDIVEDRYRRPPPKGSGPVELELVPPGQPRGVPLAEQLQVRGPDGERLQTPSISLQEHRPMPGHPDPEMATLPRAAIVDGNVWLIWASKAT